MNKEAAGSVSLDITNEAHASAIRTVLAPSAGLVCVATISNLTAASLGAVITGVTLNFGYADGKPGPLVSDPRLNLRGPSGTAQLYSEDRCVHTCYCAMKYTHNGGTHLLTLNANLETGNNCSLGVTFKLQGGTPLTDNGDPVFSLVLE